MRTVILTSFDQRNRPVTTAVADGSNTVIYDLYKQDSRKLLSDVKKDVAIIRNIFKQDNKIVVNDFMRHFKAFELSQDDLGPNIYDIQVSGVDPNRIAKSAKGLLPYKPRIYESLLARAAVAYAGLSAQSLVYNYGLERVDWSLETFTKRSKTLGFNLQGFTDSAKIRTSYASEKDVLVCFDWMAADIRAVAALASDEILTKSFLVSDPYSYIKEVVGGDITRDECKLLLLKVINSLDYRDQTINAIYPRLCEWLRQQDGVLDSEGGIQSLLGRRFSMTKDRGKLSALNGVIQGTVAHAMHRCIREVWDAYPHRLVGEIHDSIIMNCPPIGSEIMKMIKNVTRIMCRPFDGLVDRDIIFPVRISVGKKWKAWTHSYTSRGAEIVSETQSDT
jgi:hypothetical protein